MLEVWVERPTGERFVARSDTDIRRAAERYGMDATERAESEAKIIRKVEPMSRVWVEGSPDA